MKRILFLTALATAVAASAQMVKPYSEAVKEKRDLIVLCVGSGWMKNADRYLSAFTAAANPAADDAVWCVYDRASGITKEEINALGRLPCEIYSYPALIYRDGDGRVVFQRENIRAKDLKDLASLVAETAAKVKARDRALEAARQLSGREKAAALGKALSPLLDPVLSTYSERAMSAYQNSVNSIVNEIKAADPADTDGWALKYTFNYFDFAKGQRGSDFESYIAKSALLPVQKQFLYALMFKRELDKLKDGEPSEKAVWPLEKGIALAPSTPVAESLRNMRDYYVNPVRLENMRWLKRDNRPRWQKATLDASASVKEPGEYRVTFKEAQGGTDFRNVGFAGAEPGVKLDGRGKSWRCRFPGGEPTLELEIRGSGWFDGHGDIEIAPDCRVLR